MSSPRVIYLVRHGEAAASWGQSADPGLSALGREQAERACGYLRKALGEARPQLVSSPLLRARETAEPLARQLDLDPVIDERFREIPSPVPLAERQDWLRGFMRGRWSEQDETLHGWRSGIMDALEALPDRSVVFSHFLVLNAIVGWQEQRDETLVFWPANASVTELRGGDRSGWQVSLGEQMRSRVN